MFIRNEHNLALATLREKCSYSEFFRSVFSPNAGKYGPEKLRIRTLFMQCRSFQYYQKRWSLNLR